MLRKRELPSAKALLSAAASAAATAVLIQTVAREYVPHELRDYLRVKLSSFFSSMASEMIVTIDEFDGLHENQLFRAAEVYLGTKISPSTQRFRASIPAKETEVILSMDRNQVMIDEFEGVEFKWKKVYQQAEPKSRNRDEERSRAEISYFELSFHKNHRDMVLNSYFPHILSQFLRFKQEKKTLQIHMLKYRGSGKSSVNLDHPATFETLAMDPEMKKMILDDLDMFVRRKDFYRRVGKAWKRGYLLYGPPGTGKSSLIAAIANHLKFDIYDLELADLSYNSDLRRLLISTANRSILVVEDIDCSIDLDDRKKQTTADDPHNQQAKQMTKPQISLSGLLNFIDGLWSSCGDERIIIFTTNHKERLDPALLRPGRMDFHIHMSYCTPCVFQKLASNYLGITEHPLFKEVKELMPTAKVTPAEVAEQLMRTEDPESALRGLVEFLKLKKEENDLKADSPEKGSETSEITTESEEDGLRN